MNIQEFKSLPPERQAVIRIFIEADIFCKMLVKGIVSILQIMVAVLGATLLSRWMFGLPILSNVLVTSQAQHGFLLTLAREYIPTFVYFLCGICICTAGFQAVFLITPFRHRRQALLESGLPAQTLEQLGDDLLAEGKSRMEAERVTLAEGKDSSHG